MRPRLTCVNDAGAPVLFDERSMRVAILLATLVRHPVENVAEAHAEDIVTAHLGKPQFRLEAGEIGSLIAHLRTFEG